MSILSNFPNNNPDSGVFIVTYGKTTNAEIQAAFDAKKAVFVFDERIMAPLANLIGPKEHVFLTANTKMTCINNVWSTEIVSTEPKPHASQHASSGSDPITPADIGAATIDEVNNAIQAAIGNAIGGSY